MKIWVLSDLHDDRGVLDVVRPPDFDVYVCAGDVVSADIGISIEMVAALASGKPAVFVGGNHEWEGAPLDVVAYNGRRAAERHNVHWLELDSIEIGGVRFAGATLWTPFDARYSASVEFLKTVNAGVIVTHFEPGPEVILPTLTEGGVWIYGHHHGFMDRRTGSRRLIRNALGYGGGEVVDGEPARPGHLVVI